MPVRYEARDRIAVVTLDRPEAMNALDPPMLFGLAEAWDAAEEDDDVWVVVITGAGDQAFCSGADLKSTIPAATGAGPEPAERFPNMARTLLRGRFYPKPIVAAVNGHCIAGGLEMLLATDLRYAAPNATFALQEVRWGLFPLAGSTVRLPRQVPYCRAMELLLVGDRVDAAAALQMGLVNEVVDDALGRALEVAARITENGPFAVRKIKESVVRGLGLPMEQAYAEELRLGAEVFASEDAVEGPRAFVEKRPPNFTGR
ncbi:MAG TPA: enoyl-CoA hydratase-related protein [Acidimicrobiales bacterium]|jgi:enoyl-CoA hydratase/carnithine racemase|nr:enoyl-CoA hydratase-related protein [Acidimicrobiales bacterium]